MIENLLSKISGKERKILYFALVVVGLAFLDRLFLGPVMEKLDSVNQDIAEQKIIIQRDAHFLQYQDRILEDNAVFDEYFFEGAKDEDVISADFLSVIEKIATKNSITLVRSNPSRGQTHKDFIEYFADTDCTGKLQNIIKFMYDINATDELLKIVKFNMTPKRGSTDDEMNVSMTIQKFLISRDMKKDASAQ